MNAIFNFCFVESFLQDDLRGGEEQDNVHQNMSAMNRSTKFNEYTCCALIASVYLQY